MNSKFLHRFSQLRGETGKFVQFLPSIRALFGTKILGKVDVSLAGAVALMGLFAHVYFDYKNDQYQQASGEYRTTRLGHIEDRNDAIHRIADACDRRNVLLKQMNDALVALSASKEDPPAAP